jgi:pyrroline-5-carboxylate reductase
VSVDLPRIAILGTGSMGGAILSGLLSPDVAVDGGIRVTNRTEAKAEALRSDGVESWATDTDPDANVRAVDGAGVVLLGVKPAGIAELLASVSGVLAPDAIVVSVAAGVRIATMEAVTDRPVLRAMPNTPALIGRGVTGLAAGSRVSDAQLALARTLFETVGEVLVVPESQIDALSTISGSGPAYVFLLIEELTRTAEGLGFAPQDARLLVERTFSGAIALLEHTGEEPAELRRRVTSPKGTTERAIAELQAADLKSVFDRATAAALARAHELAGPPPASRGER